jgi:hypothetical protein
MRGRQALWFNYTRGGGAQVHGFGAPASGAGCQEHQGPRAPGHQEHQGTRSTRAPGHQGTRSTLAPGPPGTTAPACWSRSPHGLLHAQPLAASQHPPPGVRNCAHPSIAVRVAGIWSCSTPRAAGPAGRGMLAGAVLAHSGGSVPLTAAQLLLVPQRPAGGAAVAFLDARRGRALPCVHGAIVILGTAPAEVVLVIAAPGTVVTCNSSIHSLSGHGGWCCTALGELSRCWCASTRGTPQLEGAPHRKVLSPGRPCPSPVYPSTRKWHLPSPGQSV